MLKTLLCTHTFNYTHSIKQKDPMKFLEIAQSIYALWPNVLLLFGLVYVTVNGAGVPPKRKLRPFHQHFTQVQEAISMVNTYCSLIATSVSSYSSSCCISNCCIRIGRTSNCVCVLEVHAVFI
jgi:hypothetical protein